MNTEIANMTMKMRFPYIKSICGSVSEGESGLLKAFIERFQDVFS